jgi:hypothetical protein
MRQMGKERDAVHQEAKAVAQDLLRQLADNPQALKQIQERDAIDRLSILCTFTVGDTNDERLYQAASQREPPPVSEEEGSEPSFEVQVEEAWRLAAARIRRLETLSVWLLQQEQFADDPLQQSIAQSLAQLTEGTQQYAARMKEGQSLCFHQIPAKGWFIPGPVQQAKNAVDPVSKALNAFTDATSLEHNPSLRGELPERIGAVKRLLEISFRDRHWAKHRSTRALFEKTKLEVLALTQLVESLEATRLVSVRGDGRPEPSPLANDLSACNRILRGLERQLPRPRAARRE